MKSPRYTGENIWAQRRAAPHSPGEALTSTSNETDASGWEGLFWQAFRQSQNAMALLDTERRIQEVNPALERLLGYGREVLIGKPMYDFVADGPVVSSEEWRAALQGQQFSGEADLVSARGDRITVECAGHPECVTGRRLVLVVALHTTRHRHQRPDRAPLPAQTQRLSERELQVVRLIAMGLNGSEIAAELHVAHNTVRTHVRNAMAKVGARSRAQLVAKALGDGLLLAREQ